MLINNNRIILAILIVIQLLVELNSAQSVKIELSVNNGLKIQELNIGLDPKASDGKDSMEIELPPIPPPEVFFSWIEINDPIVGKLRVKDDYRHGENSSMSIGSKFIHKIKWQLGDDGIHSTLCWDVKGVKLNLSDEFGGIYFDYNITSDGPGCFSIPNPNLTSLILTIEYLNPPFSYYKKNYFDFKTFLEGPYKNGKMAANLKNLIPLKQPYGNSKWNFCGNEQVNKIPSRVIDWVLVELKEDNQNINFRRAAFLRDDGFIVDLDGLSMLKFNNLTIGNYYVVIYHRNHLPIISLVPILITN